LEALKDPENGDLLIVCDGNQGIRPIGSVSWKSIGIKAKGRTIHQAYDLDRNYRNTEGILKLASHFTSQNIRNNEDSICVVAVDPAHAMRKGPRPMLYRCKSHTDECRRILHIVKRLLEGKATLNDEPVSVLPQEIGILYHGMMKHEKDLFNEFVAELSKICPVTWLNQFTDSRTKIFEHSLKVQTVHSSKGLQYRVILLMWSDMFAPHSPDEHDKEQRLLYVALTRASDILIVTCSKKNEFIERMVVSGDIEGA
jgi:superfamily I DNA/RNA helicase